MTDLERQAERWVLEIHPHKAHLITARDWADRLGRPSTEALRIAAVLHDIERAFPDPGAGWDPAADWDDPAYLRWHQDRSAHIAGEWLRDQDAAPDLIVEVERLVAVHEDGGWPEADALQAADSLSFFETVTAVTVMWVREGAPYSRAESKLRYMHDRITFEPAKEPARRLLASSLEELEGAVGTRRSA